ncbi:MAG: CHAT domain-containing protein, partial [Scytonema sp. PMC 1069.18]|nr:CHAT domain-containing protein [Scytonema sp. PMC 1069.18]
NYNRAIDETNKIVILAPEALKLAKEEKDLATEKEILIIQSQAYLFTGNVYIELEEPQKAYDFLQQGLNIALQSRDLKSEDYALVFLSRFYEFQNNNIKIIELNQRRLEIARKLGTTHIEALILLYTASVYNSLGDYQQGINFAQQALDKADIIDFGKIPENRKNTALLVKPRALTGLSMAYKAIGEYDKALEFAQQSLDVAQSLNDSSLKIEGLIQVADIYLSRQDSKQAIEFYQQALTIAKETKKPELEAEVLNNLSKAYRVIGDYKQALNLTQQILVIAEKIKKSNLKIKVLDIQRQIYSAQGNYKQALDLLQQILILAKQDKSSFALWGGFLQLSLFYNNFGEYQKAIEYSQQALIIAQKRQNPETESATQLLLASIYFNKGEPQKTIEFANQGLAVSQNQKMKMIELEMLGNTVLSTAYGELDNDQKAMEAAQAGLTIAKKSKNPYYEKYLMTLLGSIHQKFGRIQEAIQAYNQALAIKTQAKTVGENSGIYAGLARIYRDLNQPNVAIAYYKDAINSIEEVRRGVEGLTPEIQKSFLNATVDFNRVKTADVYKELADLLIKQGQEAEAQGRKDDAQVRYAQAQQVMDLIKIQEVKDFARNITGKPQLPLANVEKQIQTGNQTVIALAGKIRECERTKCQQLSQLNDQLTALLQETNRKLKEIDKEIGDRLSKDPSAFRPDSPKPQEVVKAQLDTIMIYPFVREEKLWLLTYFDKGRMVREVSVTRKELDNQVKEFRKLMEECEKQICGSAEIAKIKPVSQKLYNWLIKPLEPELETNKVKNLVFALDSTIRYIPMSALFNGDRYLIENYTIYNVFSADLTNTTDKFPLNPSVLAMGLSDAAPPKFGSLPYVPQELNAIAKTNTRDKDIYSRPFLNNNFTFLTLRDHLAGHNILHLATHGEFVPGKKDASYILSGKEEISILEIATLGLSEIHLVVLSACQTALASSLHDGVEIGSLAYHFLNSGAKSVIASLWQVADQSTAETMQNFYKYMRTSRQPITKAEALRMAQLSLLYSKDVTVEDIKRGGIIPEGIPGKPTKNQTSRTTYAHPYYWAPFILIGNGL